MNQKALVSSGNFFAAPISYGAEFPNLSIEYMYRDASNYKCFEVVSFANPQRITAAEIWRQINEVLEGVMLFPEQPIFRPEWVGLPTVFLFGRPGYSRNDDDHDWHEMIAVEETDCPPTFGEDSGINNFIDVLRRTHKKSF